MVGRARSLAGHGLLLLRSVVHPLFTFEKALRLTIRDKVGAEGVSQVLAKGRRP